MHSLNIADVQKETIRLLHDTQNALKDVLSSSYVVDCNEADQQQTLEKGFITQQQNILKNETQKAENLEMVIAVVGTMKAGKSTSINAIVGQEVLPNRALPMTALPTLVTHTPGKIEAVLYFKYTQPLVDLSRQLISKLDCDNSGSKFLESEVAQKLSVKLKQNNGFRFTGEYRGQAEIFEFLQELNDLMRMAKELEVEPPYAEYQSVESLPRIEVEFYHLRHSSAKTYGRLSILDTPGPNEFGQSDALKKVFQMQLRQASAVLLVMDYTQLNSESDGALRQEVDSIKEDLGDRLFVLVNKFDNANKNTMNKEQTRSYVATKLLSKFPVDKVFPVSSQSGFLANTAFSEVDRNGVINPSDAWVKDFAKKVFGEMWDETDLEDIERVKRGSGRLWESSGFEDPLDKVIKEAHAKAAFEALESSLVKISNLVGELDKGAKGRVSGLETDAKTLKDIVVGIEGDLNTLDVLEDKFKKNINAEIEIIKNKVVSKTNYYIEEAIAAVVRVFTTTAKEENEKKLRSRSKAKMESSIFHKSPVLRAFFNNGFIQSENEKFSTNDAQQSELSDFSVNSEGKILFAEEGATKEFLKKVVGLLELLISDIDSSVEPIIKNKLAKLQNSIDNLMEENVNKIIEKAQEKLKDNGVEVVFRLPSFIMKDCSEISHHSFLDNVEDKSEMRVGSRRQDGYWAGFKNSLNDDWGREDYDYEFTQFEVSLKSIEEQAIVTLNKHADKIKESQTDFLANKLNAQVSEHINNIQSYLDRYRGDLIQGLEDQRKNGEKKEQQKIELELLIPQLCHCLEDADDQSKVLNVIRNESLQDSQVGLSNEKRAIA